MILLKKLMVYNLTIMECKFIDLDELSDDFAGI